MSSSRLKILITEYDTLPLECMEQFRSIAEVELLPEGAELKKHLFDADLLITKLAHYIDEETINSASNLKAIATPTTGLNHIDQIAAKARNIKIISLKGETDFLNNVTATAEHNWGLLLALIRNTVHAHQEVISGEWQRNHFHGVELSCKTLGIIGVGRLGRMTASYAQAFRMNVNGCDPYAQDLPNFISMKSIEEVFESSDVICIHLPYNDETHHLVSKSLLERCKKNCVITNTARGEVIDENALLEILQTGHIAGFAADVLCGEALGDGTFPSSSRLVQYAKVYNNVVLTPHIGGATNDSLLKAETHLTNLILRYCRDKQP